MKDLIERQEAIDELKRISFSHWFECGEYLSEDTKEIKIISSSKALEAIEALPPAQPESTRTFVELIVGYPDPELCTYKEYKGKPYYSYYSIKYIENGETYIGYGTYNPKVLSQYLKEYFILSAQPERCEDCENFSKTRLLIPQPEIIHCRECKHRDKDGECGQYDDGTVAVSCKVPDDHYCGYAERRTDELRSENSR